MPNAIHRLLTLKVGDVMAKEVVVVLEDETLAKAAKAFAEHDVTSAPVVDAYQNCVGMLSATDFARGWAGQAVTTTDQYVHHAMSTEVLSTRSEESLLNAARQMCRAHLHRLPVLENGRPVGVISTMDVVAAMVNAIEEMTLESGADVPSEGTSGA